jgi:hypothetical protein
MGMYTELVIVTQIKDDPEVVKVIKHLIGEEECETLPEHPFFQCPRFDLIMICNSHYFIPLSAQRFVYNVISKTWSLITRADFKNYNDEIALFCDWIDPYLDCSTGEMFGYSRYEEDEDPIILRKKGE